MMASRAPGDRSSPAERVREVWNAGSFRRQLMISTAAMGAAVAIVLLVVVQIALAQSVQDSISRVLSSRADAVLSSANGASRDGELRIPDSDLDAGVAIYDSRGNLVEGTVPPSLAAEYKLLSTVDRPQQKQVDGSEIWAEPFRTQSGITGVIVLTEQTRPYEEGRYQTLWVTVLAGAVIVGLATFLAGWASRRALAPVARMASTADSWGEQNLESRFDLGPPTNEIRALGQTLDRLLERVHRVILQEQRLTSELAHELRSPLAAISATAELIAMRTDLDDELRTDLGDILATCRSMALTVTSLLDLARHQSGSDRRDEADLGSVISEIRRSVDPANTISAVVPPQSHVAAPTELVVRALSPVVENAVQRSSAVTITVEPDGLFWRVVVSDDGPGVAAEISDTIFDAGISTGAGSGLGLALAQRVARSIGGDVQVGAQVDHGATFLVRLPRAD